MDTPSVSQQRVTDLLTRWSEGDDAVLAELTPLVYEELRRLAHRQMGAERPDHTLQTTALVSEAYLRRPTKPILAGKTVPTSSLWPPARCAKSWATPGSANGKARWRRAENRIGRGSAGFTGGIKADRRSARGTGNAGHARLQKSSSGRAEIFGGLNYDEMAEVLKISPVTVRRDWRFARPGCTQNCRTRTNRND